MISAYQLLAKGNADGGLLLALGITAVVLYLAVVWSNNRRP